MVWMVVKLDLAGIFYGDDATAMIDELEDAIEERRLTGRCAARDKDVAPLLHRIGKSLNGIFVAVGDLGNVMIALLHAAALLQAPIREVDGSALCTSTFTDTQGNAAFGNRLIEDDVVAGDGREAVLMRRQSCEDGARLCRIVGIELLIVGIRDCLADMPEKAQGESVIPVLYPEVAICVRFVPAAPDLARLVDGDFFMVDVLIILGQRRQHFEKNIGHVSCYPKEALIPDL